ncbi:MAG: SecD/SecF fusion protein [Actinomycetota bacterium]|nr:secD [Cryptosporangiaceae bacterium]MDQ1678104.1 SecD/SecF fusion protein [Actinomycetota bacterium]
MSRAPLVRALVALGILAASLYFALTSPARLGLDLRGGTQIVLETRDSPTVRADAASTDRAVEVLRQRVDALGISEPTLARSGERRIIVELPGVQDPREAAEVIGRTAQLAFHPVLAVAGAGEADGPVLPDESGQRLRLGPAALTGAGVSDAKAQVDPQSAGGWYVGVDFKGSGRDAWERLTGAAACEAPGDPARRVAIVLDDQVISSPQVEESVACRIGITGGSTQITGSFGGAEAKDLAVLIRGGALPVPVEVIEQRTVGATLGVAAIEASATAAVLGVLLTGLFIIVVYRLVGALATVALAGYALISYATLVALGATLTLPGLAGFVLAIGMAIDANVLVFERAREEYHGQGLRSAVTTGFAKAWSAIIDSNVTTLLAAGLLFFLASGPVRGFGVTLAIGVLASMVSALVVTRVFVEWALRRGVVMSRPGLSGIAAPGRVREWLVRRNPNLMRYRRRWLAVSALALVLAVSGIAVRGLDLGVEFTGGRMVEYSTSAPLDVDAARAAVSDAGFPGAVVQESGRDNLSVRTGQLSNDEEVTLRAALADAAGGPVSKERDELIGPSLGDELRTKALIALGIALAAQLAYLAVRFRWTFAASTVVAMAHDVLILVGMFAWLGKPLDGVFLAALLTVVGYSVNDSVVVFDRIRELWTARRTTPFPEVVNSAILQTVPRTVNTGLGAVFILAALAFLGGDSLTDFAIALLIGIGVGTYSSMFTAGPLAIELEARTGAAPPRVKPARRGEPARRADSGAVV